MVIVEHTGLEPVTPTLSKLCSKPTELIFRFAKVKIKYLHEQHLKNC